jgi:hypothetical protein
VSWKECNQELTHTAFSFLLLLDSDLEIQRLSGYKNVLEHTKILQAAAAQTGLVLPSPSPSPILRCNVQFANNCARSSCLFDEASNMGARAATTRPSWEDVK